MHHAAGRIYGPQSSVPSRQPRARPARRTSFTRRQQWPARRSRPGFFARRSPNHPGSDSARCSRSESCAVRGPNRWMEAPSREVERGGGLHWHMPPFITHSTAQPARDWSPRAAPQARTQRAASTLPRSAGRGTSDASPLHPPQLPDGLPGPTFSTGSTSPT
jgi:hypothetical protein